MSQYGNLQHIVDLETLLGYSLSLVDFTSITDETINYSWGDESELVNWIHHKDENISTSGNFYTISGENVIDIDKRTKYPLIWLVTPVRGVSKGDIKDFGNVRIIVASNTQEDWLNSTRWKKRIPMLQAIADKVISGLKSHVKIKREQGQLQYSFMTKPKYSVKETETSTLDLWDAVVIDVSLLVSEFCRDEAYFNFCNQ